jgi:GT2 family glycosyltransferase
MKLSIVIGTRHRPESLRRCLDSLARQIVRPDEVVIVDDGQLDPAPFVESLERTGIAVQYFNKSHDAGLTKSRNLGIRQSRGDIVMFLDDDVELEPQYMQAILRVYDAHPEVGGVGGRLNDPPLSWPKRRLLRAFLLDSHREGAVLANGVGVLVRSITRDTAVEWFSGCNMSYRRQVFDRFMFDEEFAGNGWGDDRDFSYAVSRVYPLMCAPDAALLHHEEPRARARARDFGEIEITYVNRFFVKHMPHRLKNVAALWWAFTGITLKNLLTARFGRVRGNVAGMRDVVRGRRRARRALGVLSEQGGSIRNLDASGQGGRFVQEYLRRYAEAFPQVFYFSYEDEQPSVPAGCTVVPNRRRVPRWVYAFVMPLQHARAFRECAVLRVMQLTGEVPAIIAKMLYGVPFVATYGYDYAANARAEGAGVVRTRLFRIRTAIALRFADRVIVTNPAIRSAVEQRIGPANVLFVPNAVDTERFAPSNADAASDRPVVLFVGRFSPEKNLPLLIGAISRLRGPVTLRLVGSGPLKASIAAQAAERGVQVEFPGVLEHYALPDEFRRATIFVLPSSGEGHPKVLIEAMSCACACVGTDVRGIRELISDRDTGLLVPVDEERLAAALDELLCDAPLRRRLGASARAYVMQHYDIAATLAHEIDALKRAGGLHP